jgi:micrococcal nuclease
MWIMLSLLAKGSLALRMTLLHAWGSRFAVLSLLLLIHSGWAGAEIYTWVDRDGQVHFTDNASMIPPEYRDHVQTRPSSPPSESSPLPAASEKSKKRQATKSPLPGRLSSGGRAKVAAVLDGDTIVISGGEKVRYAGLNTPESRHPDKLPEYCGQEAFEANRRLVAGKTVRLEYGEQHRDKYGRLLAYVYVDGLFVNAELIRQGYAQVSTYKDNQRHHTEFERLQQHAIAARRGMWGGCVDLPQPQQATQSKSQAARKRR